MKSRAASASTTSPSPPGPAPFHWLENGRYAVLLTASGSGCSAFDNYLLTAWRFDPIEGNEGLIIFVRDLDSRTYWTASGRPVPGQEPGRIARAPDGIVLDRKHESLATTVHVRLHDTLGIELRHCTLTNVGTKPRRIELTSFAEVVLNHPAAHDGHPAFSKLFVQTSVRGDGSILVAKRRPRAHGDVSPVLMHALFDAPVADFGTDRARFLGRGRNPSDPRALTDIAPLGGTCGNVLDPALALRTAVTLEPGITCTVRFVLAAGHSSDALLRQVELLRHGTLEFISPVEPGGRPTLTCDEHVEFLRTLAHGLEPLAALRMQPVLPRLPRPARRPQQARKALRFFNGYGGFNQDGREYTVRILSDSSNRPMLPPAPWTNVIANPNFGCIVSETGAGTIWSGNSREHRLTPWSNDPVVDPHGDALYVRDQESHAFWSPVPGPATAPADFEARHGFGYSLWHHCTDELDHEVTVFVPVAETLRLARVRIRNTGARRRRLALYAYNRWAQGSRATATRTRVTTAFSAPLQAVLARNEPAPDGSCPVAFAATDQGRLAGWSADRAHFLGVPGTTAAPAVLMGDGELVHRDGSDPCAVLRVLLDLEPGANGGVTFLLGEAPSEAQVATLLEKFRRPGQVEATLHEARDLWTRTFSQLRVETPSPALDVMVNGWLPYQDIACRMWARSAFYQSGGAFGFRDQIQDAAAIVLLRPDLTRAQILLHASHQFVEGDVLHWWHPPRSQGLRTRFADDLLWLPWVTAYYVGVTGDRDLLAVRARYLAAPPLDEGEDEAFLLPDDSGQSGDVYEHCCRAIDRSLTRGEHGLPLFGSGDWNDGMNRVGREGRGESVWMGFFLVTVLDDFLPLCELRADVDRATRYREHRDRLREALNADGWDGAWYRRGWYDNGAVLGSASSDECRIDALVQAWAVISKSAPPERMALALDSLEQHLVDDHERLIRLLTPPFVDTPNDPGYIKGYVAGVRENGGQYTHAATWVVKAMAEAGRRDRAMQLFEALIPVNHSLDTAAADKYKVEPYVVAADVYGSEPHVGRGGWTWYTGSAGWMYRVAVETLLGFSIEGGRTLTLRPRIPDAWPGFKLDYAVDEQTRIHLDVHNPGRRAARVTSARLDDEPCEVHGGALRIDLPGPGRVHQLTVTLGE
jgi:cyclic beta-1,2-glucan synthetase